MKLVSFTKPDGSESFGRVDGDTINELKSAQCPDLKSAIAANSLESLPTTGTVPLADITYLPVVPNPEKIICIGLNYANHVKETGREQKKYPTIFTRWTDSLAAHDQPLLKPDFSDRFDYEGELAIIIGKSGRFITQENAMSHIAGYSVFNDGSVRDWQRHNIQFVPGKNYPQTGGFGPFMITPEDISDVTALRVQTRVNGDLVQDQPVSDMIWDIPFLIEYISTFTPLSTGDVIVTGTPGGVGDKRTPPLYLFPGDTVEISVEGVGKLTNSIQEISKP